MGLKNQKSCAVERLLPYIPQETFEAFEQPKRAVKNTIRDLADREECFENMVFEIGCEVLAREVIKEQK